MIKKFAELGTDGFVMAFYSSDVHRLDQIPGNTIQITDETHEALLRGQENGKLMRVMPDGTPELVDRPAPSMESLRTTAWDRVKAERDRRKAGGVLITGHWIQSDADSRIQWLGIKDTARDLIAEGKPATEPVTVLGEALRWKTLTGAFASVTVQMAFDVVLATKELDARLFAVAEQKHMEINASEDPAAYDVQAGWPATFAG